MNTTKETFSQNLELQKTVIKQHLLDETNAGSIIGQKRNRGSASLKNKEDELDSEENISKVHNRRGNALNQLWTLKIIRF